MAVSARTVTQFATEMRSNIINFYARRGLAGPKLHQYAQRLQNITFRLRDSGASKDDIKKALAREQAQLLRFPQSFDPSPQMDSSFLTVKQGGLTMKEASLEPEKRVAFVEDLLTNAYKAFFKGTIGSEGHYAGLGTRLESPKPKFNMNPDDLLQGLKKFSERIEDPRFKDDKTYIALKDQIIEAGGLSAIIARYGTLRKWSIGERIFLAKIYDVYKKLSEKFGVTPDSFRQKIHSMKFKIIVNAQSGGNIIDEFVKNNFFGLNPYNVLFMNQAQYQTSEVKEDGSLSPDEKYISQGNHGLIPIQANLEGQWFRVIPDRSERGYREETITTTDYKDFQSGITTLVVESVEDTMQYVFPYDYTYLSYVEKLGRELGVQMFMKIVGQKKENPQKGGFLASVSHRGEDGLSRLVNRVIESNRAPELTPAEITHLNQNRNAFFNPNAVDDQIMASAMIEDLHPTFEPQGKDMELRIDPKVPQGDRNLYLKTTYMMDDPPQAIMNLKDPADILPTLRQMERMESNPEVVKFAESIGLVPSRRGLIYVSNVLRPPIERIEFKTPADDRPLSMADIVNGDYAASLTSTASDHIRAALEMTKVVGSFIRRYDIDDDGKVYIQTMAETMRGKAKEYPSNAMNRTLASDSRATVARNSDKVYIGSRHGFELIELPNRQSSRSGEIITLIIEYKQVEKERLYELFSGKIRRVIEMVRDKEIEIDDSAIIDMFLDLSPRVMLSTSASRIADMIAEKGQGTK